MCTFPFNDWSSFNKINVQIVSVRYCIMLRLLQLWTTACSLTSSFDCHYLLEVGQGLLPMQNFLVVFILQLHFESSSRRIHVCDSDGVIESVVLSFHGTGPTWIANLKEAISNLWYHPIKSNSLKKCSWYLLTFASLGLSWWTWTTPCTNYCLQPHQPFTPSIPMPMTA